MQLLSSCRNFPYSSKLFSFLKPLKIPQNMFPFSSVNWLEKQVRLLTLSCWPFNMKMDFGCCGSFLVRGRQGEGKLYYKWTQHSRSCALQVHVHVCIVWMSDPCSSPASLWSRAKLLPQSEEILTLSLVTKGERLGILKIEGRNKWQMTSYPESKNYLDFSWSGDVTEMDW